MMSVFLTLALLFSPAALLSPAHGQIRPLPDPITTEELLGYLDRLGLSMQQKLAAEAMHDEYLKAYRELEDAEIRTFRDRTMSRDPEQIDLTEVQRARQRLQQYERLMERITALDRDLFQQILPMLTDEQAALIPRVELARERHRLHQTVGQYTSTIGMPKWTDLSPLYHQLDLSAEHRAVAHPLIADYEDRFTRIMRQLHEHKIRFDIEIAIAREQVDLSDVAPDDVNLARQTAIGQRVRNYYDRERELASELSLANERTLEMLSDMLPRPVWRRLRNACYQSSWIFLGQGAGIATIHEDLVREVSTNLSDDQWQIIQQRVFDPQRAFDESVRRYVQSFHSLDRSIEDITKVDPTVGDQLHALHQSLFEQVNEFRTSAWDALTEVLSAQQVTALREWHAEMTRGLNLPRHRPPAAIVARKADAVLAERTAIPPAGPDPFVPRMVAESDLPLYATVLDLDETQQPRLRELIQNHIERNADFQATVLEPLAKAADSLNERAPDSLRKRAPNDGELDTFFQLRQRAMQEVLARDIAFLDSVEKAFIDIVEPHLIERLRLLRAREYWSRAHWLRSRRGDRTLSIDLVRLITLLQLQPDERTTIEPIVQSYEQAVTPLLQQLYDYSVRWQRLQEDREAYIRSPVEQRTVQDHQLHSRLGQQLADLGDPVERTGREILQYTDDAMTELLSTLSDENQARLDELFRLAAYPLVYNTDHAGMAYLRLALDLRTLTPDQRSQLEDFIFDFRSEYEALSDALARTHSQEPIISFGLTPFLTDFATAMESAERRREIERLNFDRDALNNRAIRRLKQILTPQQIEAIGGLPEPGSR